MNIRGRFSGIGNKQGNEGIGRDEKILPFGRSFESKNFAIPGQFAVMSTNRRLTDSNVLVRCAHIRNVYFESNK